MKSLSCAGIIFCLSPFFLPALSHHQLQHAVRGVLFSSLTPSLNSINTGPIVSYSFCPWFNKKYHKIGVTILSSSKLQRAGLVPWFQVQYQAVSLPHLKDSNYNDNVFYFVVLLHQSPIYRNVLKCLLCLKQQLQKFHLYIFLDIRNLSSFSIFKLIANIL